MKIAGRLPAQPVCAIYLLVPFSVAILGRCLERSGLTGPSWTEMSSQKSRPLSDMIRRLGIRGGWLLPWTLCGLVQNPCPRHGAVGKPIPIFFEPGLLEIINIFLKTSNENKNSLWVIDPFTDSSSISFFFTGNVE